MATAAAHKAVVTGATSGIGEALARALARAGCHVVAAGRRRPKLEELASKCPDGSVTLVEADVTTDAGRSAIVEASSGLPGSLRYLVHNAGTLGPMERLEDRSQDSWREVMELNVNAPLFLTQALLPQLRAEPNARILHIGSGAASRSVMGWSAYSVTKAAFRMLFMCFRDELKAGDVPVLVASVRPGIVDSPMQEFIRNSDASEFPDVEYFRGLYAKAQTRNDTRVGVPPPTDALDTCDNVAFFLRWLLMDTGDDEFAGDEWDIRDKSHHDRWTTGPAAVDASPVADDA